ncbi:MAG: phosphopantetheine-binding protein [Gammaproteobacteria bacterium]
MNEIESVVLKTIARAASVEPSAVRPDATVRELGIASLDAIEMLFELEEKFDLQFPDRAVDLGTATAADLVLAIQQGLAAKAGGLNALRTA